MRVCPTMRNACMRSTHHLNKVSTQEDKQGFLIDGTNIRHKPFSTTQQQHQPRRRHDATK